MFAKAIFMVMKQLRLSFVISAPVQDIRRTGSASAAAACPPTAARCGSHTRPQSWVRALPAGESPTRSPASPIRMRSGCSRPRMISPCAMNSGLYSRPARSWALSRSRWAPTSTRYPGITVQQTTTRRGTPAASAPSDAAWRFSALSTAPTFPWS